MTRLEYNIKIIDKLKELIIKHPDLRFGQLLVNCNIITLVPSDKQLLAEDPFNEEPKITWEKVKNSNIVFSNTE